MSSPLDCQNKLYNNDVVPILLYNCEVWGHGDLDCIENVHIETSVVFPYALCLSSRLSVRHAFVSALYILNPWWYLQITLHKCQVDLHTCMMSRYAERICVAKCLVQSAALKPLLGFGNNCLNNFLPGFS